MNRRLLLTVTLLASLSLLASLPALAAKAGGKGGGSGSSISLVLVNQVARATSGPYYGDQVTFAVDTSRTDYPWVQNRCWQGDKLVYEEWHGFFAGYKFGQTFTLGPTPSWSGGDANCTARLVNKSNGRYQTLATASYSVTD
jgi:hypothetical protein